MTFKRIDNETVRCVLTEEDMRQNGIEIEDFFRNREKVRGFLEELVEQAKTEVGYEAKHGMLSLQIVPLPENGVSITFSEKEDGGFHDVFERIKNVVSQLGDEGVAEYIDGIEQLDDEEKAKFVEDLMDRYRQNEKQDANVTDIPSDVEEKGIRKKKAPKTKKNNVQVYRFHNMDNVIASVRVFGGEDICETRLYKEKKTGDYYMVYELRKEKNRRIEEITGRVAEFGTRVQNGEGKKAYLMEHGTCLIARNAVLKIREFA